jgi:hypothetical protein
VGYQRPYGLEYVILKTKKQRKSLLPKKEYNEGQKAQENFEKAMVSLFRVPKSVVVEKIKNKPKKGKD